MNQTIAPTPVLKPLEWRQAWDGRHEQWFAVSVFGNRYEVKHFPDSFAYALSIDGKPYVDYASENEAKSAAMADIRIRILSALMDHRS